jgi:hypothetical protein
MLCVFGFSGPLYGYVYYTQSSTSCRESRTGYGNALYVSFFLFFGFDFLYFVVLATTLPPTPFPIHVCRMRQRDVSLTIHGCVSMTILLAYHVRHAYSVSRLTIQFTNHPISIPSPPRYTPNPYLYYCSGDIAALLLSPISLIPISLYVQRYSESFLAS